MCPVLDLQRLAILYGDILFIITLDFSGNPNYFTENFGYSSSLFDVLTQPEVLDFI